MTDWFPSIAGCDTSEYYFYNIYMYVCVCVFVLLQFRVDKTTVELQIKPSQFCNRQVNVLLREYSYVGI